MSHLSLAKFWIGLYTHIHIHTHFVLWWLQFWLQHTNLSWIFFWQYLQNNRLVKTGGSGFCVVCVCVCSVFQTKLKALLPGPCPCPNAELLRNGREIGALVKGSSTTDIPQTAQSRSGKHCCANCHHQRLIMKMQTGVCRVWKAASREEGQRGTERRTGDWLCS